MFVHRHIRMTPMELAAGRLMRAPDHPNGGDDTNSGTPAETGNNPPGNSTDSSGNADSTGNNAGQDDALSSFWSDPQPEAPASADSTSTDVPEGQTLGQSLLASIDAFAPPPAFTDALAEEIGQGNFEGVNNAIAGAHKAALRQSLTMQAQMLQPVVASVLSRVQDMIDSRLGNRDNQETLLEAFPSAADPKVRPMIQSVFEQSLKHTKGDRTKAVAMTKDMLKVFGKTASQDLGLEIPPSDRDGHGNGPLSSGEQNLIDELLGRS